MLRRPRWSLEELDAWARWGYASERAPDLLRPQDFSWPDRPMVLEQWIGRVEPVYGYRLTAQALAGAALTRSPRTPPWALDWCADRIDLAKLGMPFDWTLASSLPWTLVPLALAAPPPGLGRITWCLLGILPATSDGPRTPTWWEQVTDGEAREAVSQVAEFLERAESARIVFWPLLMTLESVQIRGPSLGLPLYLAGWGLKRSVRPEGILATGALDPDGRLRPVQYLETKARLAAREGFQALLAPASPAPFPEQPPGLELLMVRDLDEATCLFQGYAPGGGDRLLRQIRSVGDPDWLAAGAHLLGREAFRLPGTFDRYTAALDAILVNHTLTVSFLSTLERLVDTPDACLESLKEILEPLDVHRVLDLGARFPLAGFRLAQIHLACANHCGHPQTARCWIDVSRRLEPSLGAYEEQLTLTADHLSRSLIAERHNRYDFRASLPEDLEALLADLRALHAMRRRRSRTAVCAPLGRLWGTLAQDAGFRGPTGLDSVRERVESAQEAFGSGAVPEFREDWRRQFCYLVYAFLDADRSGDAGEALTAYLEAPLCDLEPLERLDRLDPYQHAALARYLADTGTAASWYVAWAQRQVDRPLRRHPWQLWAFNTGIIAEDRELRSRLWTLATECCLAQDPTAQAMALLPLSAIWKERLAEEEWILSRTRRVLRLLRRDTLSRDHFRTLLDRRSEAEVLEAVYAHRKRLFPFSYR